MKRAFLVLGPESSGTKFLTSILIAAGCVGDSGDVQRWDTQEPEGDLVVLRRSFPHGGKWVNLEQCIDKFRGQGYSVFALVTSRDWYAIQCSQVKTGHVHDKKQAHNNTMIAYDYIFGPLLKLSVGYEIVNYETLIRPGSACISRLLERLGLVQLMPVEIEDADQKWGI